MVKEEGRTHAQVAELLRARGIDPKGLKVATLTPGTDHLVLIGADTIGEYNHRSRKLTLYRDTKQS